MPLVIGSHLGTYEVLAQIGVGGMGEVYRARDTKLGRSVAVKVLPEAFLADPDRVARFEREAKVLASLNHPNIAVLYGMEEAGGRHFLVMELVEGDTLAERLQRGAMKVEDAVRTAQQIAEALEAAHEKGIVHRDLKPANIKLTDDDKVKVLDFGLARAMDPLPGADAGSKDPAYANSPTLSMVATQAGVILGTAAYMSPEQAKGLQADHRSDIFSFGVVLHEMLTGRQPFQGETAAEVLASVLVREADLSGLPADLNPRLVELLRRCLEKHPKKRWQAIGDVRAELDTIAGAPRSAVTVASTAAAPVKPLWRRAIPAVAASLVVGALSVGGTWFLKPSTERTDVARFTFALGEGQQFTFPGRHLVAMSPDGTRMAYAANSRLYLRSMSELDARPIPGTEDPGPTVTSPIFSPDGRLIVFYSGPPIAGGTIKKIAVTGGAAVTICPADNPFGMSWDRDTILFGQGGKGIMRVSANGGKPEVLTSVKGDELAHGPQMLPDGQSLLFTLATGAAATRWDTAKIVVQSLRSGERKTLVEGGSDARYVSTGHLVYALGGSVFAIPFDLRRLEIRGRPVPILEGVRRGAFTGTAHLSFSATGSLMYVPGPLSTSSGQQNLVLLDRTGATTPLKLPPGSYQHARISPDGKRVAFSVDDGKEVNVWVYELSGATSMRRLTFGGNNRFPIWTKDGERIAFQSDREKDLGIFWQRADTSGTAERLTKPDEGTSHVPESWSPTGDRFLYTVTKGSSVTLWTFSQQDKKSARFDAVGSSTPIGSVFSPDGRWVAYDSTETGRATVYVQPFPPTGAKYQISKNEGTGGGGSRYPIWSPDGKELFYTPVVGQFVVVAVQTQPTFTVGNPVSVPGGSSVVSVTTLPRNHDIAPDGKRFITVASADQSQEGQTATPEIRVVLNWFEELRQRVPVR